MDKQIDKLLRQLKIELGIAALMVVATIVLGEMDVIPNGAVEPKSQTEFCLTMVVVVLTLAGIPLSLKLFKLSTTKGLRRMNMDEALQSYHGWSIMRLGILALTAVCGLVVYYITMLASPVYCALAALVIAGYFCWPRRKQIEAYLESEK